MAKIKGIRSSIATKEATCSGIVVPEKESSPMNGISINFSAGDDAQRQGDLLHFPIIYYSYIMLRPVRIEPWGVPVFRLEDVNLYGSPEVNGYEDYIVLSTYEDECPFVLDWAGEQERRGSLRPVHKYSRIERFISVVYQLLGARGDVPEEVVDLVRFWGYDKDPKLMWNSVRFVLKQYNYAKYYNRIPTILGLLGERLAKFNHDLVVDIFLQFRSFSSKFDAIKATLKERSYFPNLRYVALRLLEERGIVFRFHIPKIRTKRKVKVMENIYELLCA